MKLDTKNWMANLGDDIKSLKIKNVVLPGTHDSHTDTKYWYQNGTIRIHWDYCRAQSKSPQKQLEDGIRYFDLRYQWNHGKPAIWHGKLHTKTFIEQTMGMVEKFVRDHPKEIIILDLTHWNNMNVEKHQTAVNEITKRLKKYMVPCDWGSPDVTIEKLWRENKSVITLYKTDVQEKEGWRYHPQDDQELQDEEKKLFWRREESIVSHWPETMNFDELASNMKASLKCLSEIGKDLQCMPPDAHDKLFVLQAQRTPKPSKKDVLAAPVLRFFGKKSGLEACANFTNPKIIEWLQKWTTDGDDGDPPISAEQARENLNIVIVDFYQLAGKGKSFVETIVELNHDRGNRNFLH